LPSVSITVACWKPASFASCAMSFAPSGYPRFSAAIDGAAIQSLRRFTASS